jgi:hypothetical protein
MERLYNNSNRLSINRPPFGLLDVKEPPPWRFSKVVFLRLSSEWPVTSIPVNLFAYNQALHTILRRLMEAQMEILVVRGEEAAEQLKVHNRDREVTATSSATWKTAPSKKDSWDKVSGID